MSEQIKAAGIGMVAHRGEGSSPSLAGVPGLPSSHQGTLSRGCEIQALWALLNWHTLPNTTPHSLQKRHRKSIC